MIEIDIHIHRPVKMFLIIGGTVSLVLLAQMIVGERNDGVGGVGATVNDAEEVIYTERIEQAVLDQREEIIRYQLRVLGEERMENEHMWNDRQKQEWKHAKNYLIQLLEDRARSEQEVRRALAVLWEAEVRAKAASGDPNVPLRLSWPVNPGQGISAYFDDEEYLKRFGIPHKAIDIPAMQTSSVYAAAEGVVSGVYGGEDGYQYLIISHPGGATLYGHVFEFLVHEGQYVNRGDPIALSGGRPGTRGAGMLSTGPHVHFEVIRGGVQVDPLEYLSDEYK